MFIDYYKILDVNLNASRSDIKAAYHKQAKMWHPDRNIGSDTKHIMQNINEAYLILSDSEARFKYDKQYRKYHETKECEDERNVPEAKDSYQNEFHIDDEILKKWMKNAKKQAKRNVYELADELYGSSRVGLSTYYKVFIKIFIYYVIIPYILLYIYYFLKN